MISDVVLRSLRTLVAVPYRNAQTVSEPYRNRIRTVGFNVCLLSITFSTSSFAQDKLSANYMMEGCTRITDPPSMHQWLMISGQCYGIVETLLAIQPIVEEKHRICSPQGVTVFQAIKVVTAPGPADA